MQKATQTHRLSNKFKSNQQFLLEKNSFFKITLPYSRHTLQTLMYRAFNPREGNEMSLTLPSLLGSLVLIWLTLQREAKSKRIRFDALQAIVPSICQAVALCISVCLQVS